MEILLLFGAIYLGRVGFKRWQIKRARAEWLRNSLKVGDGLYFTSHPVAEKPPHDWTQDVQC